MMKLTDAEEKIFKKGECPDCGGKLLEGPEGGMSINVFCGGLGESRYNYLGIFGVERIGVARCPKIRKELVPPGLLSRFLGAFKRQS